MAQYDRIAEQYRDSKQLPFREFIERYTLFEILGDIRGKTVLDMACGEGFYTRLLKQAGAAEATGVDISGEMIRLAEERELAHPLGCKYLHQDAGAFKPSRPVDVVVAMYLLNYARSEEELHRFCRVCYDSLKPGGRFVGVNDNPWNPPLPSDSWAKYAFERTCTHPARDGDVIRYEVTNADGRRFGFTNFYFAPTTYWSAFRAAGFRNLRWVDLSVHPSERDNPYWDDLMARPPGIAFEATRQTHK